MSVCLSVCLCVCVCLRFSLSHRLRGRCTALKEFHIPTMIRVAEHCEPTRYAHSLTLRQPIRTYVLCCVL